MSRWALKQTKLFTEAIGKCRFRFVKMKNTYGWIIGRLILIDHSRGDVLATFAHELFHYLYPNLTQKEITMLEKKYIKESSWNNKKALMQAIVNIER